MPLPPRRIGRTPTGSTATSAASGDDDSPEEALRGFERFPAWMWRNTVVRDFVGWLRWHNGRCAADGRRQTGFYGLDLYSLHRSMQEVIGYLETVDPEAAARARARYACFDHSAGDDGQAYGYAAAFGAGPSCERQAVEQLVELQRNAWSTCAHGRRAGRRRIVLRPAERGDGAQRRGVLPRHVRAAGSRRGTCATSTWPRPWPP